MSSNSGTPESFSCPITGEVMHDPVTCSDGFSYERAAITEWLCDHATSPCTGSILSNKKLIPNITLRKALEEFAGMHGRMRRGGSQDESQAKGKDERAQTTRVMWDDQDDSGRPVGSANVGRLGKNGCEDDYDGNGKHSMGKKAIREDDGYGKLANSGGRNGCKDDEGRVARKVKNSHDEDAARPAVANAVIIGRLANHENQEPWEFDKKALQIAAPAQLRPVIVCASRTSLNTGDGVIVAYEPSVDGQEFKCAASMPLNRLRTSHKGEASAASFAKIDDTDFVLGLRDGTIATYSLKRNPHNGALSFNKTFQADQRMAHREETTCVSILEAFQLLDGEEDGIPYSIISGSRDGTIKLWRRNGPSSWTTYAGMDHGSDVKCVAATPRGLVVSGGSSEEVVLWDPNTPNVPVHRYLEHTGTVRCLIAPGLEAMGGAASYVGPCFASGSEDETVIIWDDRARKPIVAKLETGAPVLSMCWGDGFLCCGGGAAQDSCASSTSELTGGWARFYDVRNWNVIGDASISKLAPSASRSNQTTLVKYRSEGDTLDSRYAHAVATQAMSSFTLNGRPAVVTGGDDKTLRIWASPPLENHAPFTPNPVLAFTLGGERDIPISVDALVCMSV